MASANVKLSKKELLLVCDEQFILTKNLIIDKVYHLFGELSSQFVNAERQYAGLFPAEVFISSPKIYKGEQYKGLPYVLLDCPRLFTKHDAFAIRFFFWWGNFFSITFHAAGKYAEMYSLPVFEALQRNGNHWYVCVNESEWEHHFSNDNYLPDYLISNADTKIIMRKKFFKIAKKIPLQKWDDAHDFFVNGFNEILGMLKTPA